MPIKFYKALKTLKGQAPTGNTDANYELVGETITEDEKNNINSKIEAAKNYNVLSNRPSINNVVLEGNKTLAQLGINIAQTVTNNANQIPSAAAVYNFVGSSGASAIQTGVEFNTGKTLDGQPIYGKFISETWHSAIPIGAKTTNHFFGLSNFIGSSRIYYCNPSIYLANKDHKVLKSFPGHYYEVVSPNGIKAEIVCCVSVDEHNTAVALYRVNILGGVLLSTYNLSMYLTLLAYYTKL